MTIAIRAGQAQDWPTMRDIFMQAGQAAWSHIIAPAALANLSAPDRWEPHAGAQVLVAEHDGTVVGFVCLCASADEDAQPTTGEIDGFYVLPSMWSRGVGQVLLTAGLERLAASGFTEATLWTEHRNDRPLRFYRTAGWTLDGRERRRTCGGSDLVELRHRLLLNVPPVPTPGT